ncbi:RNA polymerase factor sigma-54 [Porphyromonadaceae bacterium OttesenSCG-928-L07]|nr:RNA polymerase factor sigma-54 [Porphyromonadaceae bacterium OttesenSCG-928-L07]MDL2330782.1 RNA polymerase factor sigma-54 [Odoribacter sp. OttesenSCG-928-A06]
MLKQNLQQKLGLKINPLQIQFIKLLELPTFQLEQRIKEELEENPLLEEGYDEEEYEGESLAEEQQNDEEDYDAGDNSDDDFTLEDYIDEDDIPDYKLSSSNYSKDDGAKEFIISNKVTFRESLVYQLGLKHLTTEQKKIAEYIIGNLDDDGYLRRDIENIVDDLSFVAGIEVAEEEVEMLLKVVQTFEPAGIGARDLQECLLLQVKRKRATEPEDMNLKNAEQIILEYFDEFSKKHYEKISRRLKISDNSLKDSIDEILKLNPRPGNSESETSYENVVTKIIPDFTLDLIDGELQLSLNSDNIPDLRVNKSYLNLLDKGGQGSKDQKDAASFVKYKLNSAKLFIDAIHQRNATLMLTMTAIIQLQKKFFLTGDKSQMRPMILKDVADITGLDVSTLSRVSNAKYIQTWFGIFALKDFFSGSMQNTSGEDVSTGEIKNTLKELIDAEDKKNPYTDDELVDMMEGKGYKIARRTIAKYRQMLDIPVARLRRII